MLERCIVLDTAPNPLRRRVFRTPGNQTGSRTQTGAEAIQVEALSKTYQVPEREGGFGVAVRSFFRRRYKDVEAVQQVSSASAAARLSASWAERRGQDDDAQDALRAAAPHRRHRAVLDHSPWERSTDFLPAITLVMGQRNRLSWDIPAADSFLLNQAIYRLSRRAIQRDLERARRAARALRRSCEAGAQPVAGRADEVRAGRRAAAPAAGAVPRRADHRAGRHRPGAHRDRSCREYNRRRAPPSCLPVTTWPT